jgi:DNA-binding transcriptional LysR family regulator
MLNPDSLRAFVLAAELGSFSAAARQMRKAQSAVSTAIANLEVDAGVELFDRRGRSPILTEEGRSLLPHALGILRSNREFISKASSMMEGVEGHLCLAIEQGINMRPLMALFEEFSAEYSHVSLEILNPGPNDTPALLKDGRADLGLMTEQESYPSGFQFRGVGYSKLVSVCNHQHILAEKKQVGYGDLRQHRQLISQSRLRTNLTDLGERKSASVWYAESPAVIVDLLLQGLGWAELPLSTVAQRIEDGSLVQLRYSFQQSDILEGIDAVWTEQRALGVAGQWMLDRMLRLPQNVWRSEG